MAPGTTEAVDSSDDGSTGSGSDSSGGGTTEGSTGDDSDCLNLGAPWSDAVVLPAPA